MQFDHGIDTDAGQLKRCLIVDDSSVIRKVARVIIHDFDFEVIEASDCKEARDLCGGVAPNIVLLDWNIPGEDPLAFMADLRSRDMPYRPFIVYMTTENDPVLIAKALNAGADDYILKPFTRETLSEKIEPLKPLVAIA